MHISMIDLILQQTLEVKYRIYYYLIMKIVVLIAQISISIYRYAEISILMMV